MRPALRILALCTAALLHCTASADEYPRNPNVDILHYVFHLRLSDGSDIVAGNAEITVRFLAGDMSKFHLDLVGPDGSETSGTGRVTGMSVTSITLSGSPVSYTHENDRIWIQMPPTTAGEDRIFTVSYTGIPADGLIISRNRHGERTFFGDNWPDRAHHWLPTVDHPSDKASCEFVVTAPDRYRVVANGALVEESELPDGMRLTHWREPAPLATKLMVIGVARFAVQYLDEYEGISVQSWVYPQDREAGFRDFALARPILAFFDRHIGPFSYPKLANVQSKTRYGGMENAGAIFYNEGRGTGPPRWGESLLAHEIAHQWFGDSVSEADWHHIWLSEGFATYFEDVYMEATYGRERLVEGMEGARRRVLSYYERNPASPVVDTTLTISNRLLSTNSYQKGAWVLHMLRRLLGEEVWWAGIRAFYIRHQNGNALTRDFRNVMEEVSGKDLSRFFEQWIFQPGQPKYEGTWHYDDSTGRLAIQIDQTQTDGTLFRMPVEIGIYFQGESSPRIEVLDLDEKENRFSLAVDAAVRDVVLDPNVWMLMEADLRQREERHR